MKTFTPTSVTTRLPCSTGVRPVWMGSCTRPNTGFNQLKVKNGARLSQKDAQIYKTIHAEDSQLSRIARRLGVCAGDLRRSVICGDEVVL